MWPRKCFFSSLFLGALAMAFEFATAKVAFGDERLFEAFTHLGYYSGGLGGVSYGSLPTGQRVVVKTFSFPNDNGDLRFNHTLRSFESARELANQGKFASIFATRSFNGPCGTQNLEIMMEDLHFTRSARPAFFGTSGAVNAAIAPGVILSPQDKSALADRILVGLAMHPDANSSNVVLRGKWVNCGGAPEFSLEVKLIDSSDPIPPSDTVFEDYLAGKRPLLFRQNGGPVASLRNQLGLNDRYTHPISRMTKDQWVTSQQAPWEAFRLKGRAPLAIGLDPSAFAQSFLEEALKDPTKQADIKALNKRFDIAPWADTACAMQSVTQPAPALLNWYMRWYREQTGRPSTFEEHIMPRLEIIEDLFGGEAGRQFYYLIYPRKSDPFQPLFRT